MIFLRGNSRNTGKKASSAPPGPEWIQTCGQKFRPTQLQRYPVVVSYLALILYIWRTSPFCRVPPPPGPQSGFASFRGASAGSGNLQGDYHRESRNSLSAAPVSPLSRAAGISAQSPDFSPVRPFLLHHSGSRRRRSFLHPACPT